MHPVTSVLLTERAPSVAALALDEQDAETVDRMPILAGHDGSLSRAGSADCSQLYDVRRADARCHQDVEAAPR